MVQRIGTVDSAEPHPDPSGGQAPALHFLIPPSAIGLQFGTFRPWRAGIEVDWRAHSRTNGTHETGSPKSEHLPARPAVEHPARDVLSFAQRFPPDDKSAKGALSRNGVVGGVAC